jgi:hypothetical protein
VREWIWRVRYNNELYQLFSGPDIVKTIKTGRLRCAGHVIRKVGNNPIKKYHKPKTRWGCRRVGRPKLR